MYVVPALREVEVEDSRFDGSTLRLESASYFDDELCIKARYKLGQETSAFSSHFTIPHLNVLLANGESMENLRNSDIAPI